jgi:hypothetical protein
MIELHPQIITKDGERQFVVLPYEEFTAIEEALADVDDLHALRIAKREEEEAPTVPLGEVVAGLNLQE